MRETEFGANTRDHIYSTDEHSAGVGLEYAGVPFIHSELCRGFRSHAGMATINDQNTPGHVAGSTARQENGGPL